VILKEAKQAVGGSGSPLGSPRVPDGSQALHEALARLGNLRDNGILTEDQFIEQKRRLLEADE